MLDNEHLLSKCLRPPKNSRIIITFLTSQCGVVGSSHPKIFHLEHSNFLLGISIERFQQSCLAWILLEALPVLPFYNSINNTINVEEDSFFSNLRYRKYLENSSSVGIHSWTLQNWRPSLWNSHQTFRYFFLLSSLKPSKAIASL